ncbi:MAG: T9SS type A sorting domain-containing protein [Bacteroidia bacterium]
MKKYTLVFLITISTSAFAQSWQWCSSEPYESYVTRKNLITSDDHNNVYIAGEKTNPLGSASVFFVKYDSLGLRLWDTIYPGYGYLSGLATDHFSNSYISLFTRYWEGITYHESEGDLIVKYDAGGNIIFKKRPGMFIFMTEHTDFNNELTFTGPFTKNILLEHGYSLNLSGADYKLYISKYDLNGECTWAQSADGGNYPLVVNGKGEMFARADIYSYPISVGQGSEQVNLSPGPGDMYLAKYDSLGGLDWVSQELSCEMTMDNSGNAYSLYPSPTDYHHMYLRKFAAAGGQLWQRTHFYSPDWYKFAMACDTSGNIFMTGGFSNSLTIGDTTITVSGLKTFVVKIDSSGVLQWVTISGGTGNAGAKDISIGDDGAIYITGDMGGTVCFGPHCTTQASGVFAAKLLDVPQSAATSIAGQVNDNALSVFPNPNSGVFILQYKDAKASSLMLEIRNSHGQLVFHSSEKCSNGVIVKNIDLSKEPKGIYFLEVIAGNKISTKKIVLN